MSTEIQHYVLDANAFIQAKRKFYGLDFCPGYWQALIWHHQQRKLCSIDKVQHELKQGADELWQWAQNELGDAAFASTSTSDVTEAYSEMVAWVMAQTQFLDYAKYEFQSVADGWLAAYAKAKGAVVVTLEVPDPVIRKKVPLPNVCDAFDVEYITPFQMLRRLNVQFSWQPPTDL